MAFLSGSRQHRKAAFTIVELLTVFAIIAIIGYALALITKQIGTGYARVRAMQDVQNTARTLIGQFNHTIANAFYSRTDSRFEFRGNAQALDFNALLEDAAGKIIMSEIGYTRDADGTVRERRETGAGIPNVVTGGGSSEIVAEGVGALQFRYMYKDAGGVFQYAGGVWDSRVETYGNYNRENENKNPDGLPDAVEVSFTVQDRNNFFAPQPFVTKIYIPQDA